MRKFVRKTIVVLLTLAACGWIAGKGLDIYSRGDELFHDGTNQDDDEARLLMALGMIMMGGSGLTFVVVTASCLSSGPAKQSQANLEHLPLD